MKKRILAFGDSNTWGWDPKNVPMTKPIARFSDEERWTGVAQRELGGDYVIINEGLNGRTTVWDDPIEEYRCGKHHIVPLMDTHAPLDLVIIFVGTNDLKRRFGVSAGDIARGAGLLVDRALSLDGDFTLLKPRVLLIAPMRLGDMSKSVHGFAFGGSEEKSALLSGLYEKEALARHIDFLNADSIARSSDEDALHLARDQHEILGKAIAEKIRCILNI